MNKRTRRKFTPVVVIRVGVSVFQTLRCLREQHKPYIDVDMHDPTEVADVVDWVRTHQIRVLNVAGNSRPKSRTALAWGIEEFAVQFLCQVFRALGHAELPQ